MKYKHLRTQVLAIVMTLTILLLVVVNVYNYQDRRKILYDVSIEKLLVLTKIMRSYSKKQLKLYKTRIDTIQKDPNVLHLIKKNDREKLKKYLDSFNKTYQEATPDLTHFHIFAPNGEYLYDANKHTPLLIRNALQYNKVLQQSMLNESFTTGYVIFNKDYYYYSLIAPIKYDNKIIAYVEFGLKADNTYKISSKAGRYKYVLYLNDETHETQERQLGTPVVSNTKMFQDLNMTQKFIYEYANQNKILHYKNKYYLLHQYDIETPFQKNFAQIILANDITKYVQENKEKAFYTFLTSLATLFFIFLTIYIIMTKLIKKLLKDEAALEEQREQVQIIIDHNDNFITLIQHGKLILANKPFLNYFDVENFEDFNNKHNSISELFVDTDGVYTPSDTTDNAIWIEEIKSLEENKRVIAFKHYRYGLNFFNIQINTVPHQENSFVVVFSNVTSIFKKSQQDKYMARHDTLTGVYNRQSFNESIYQDILYQEHTTHASSLLLFDLDYFKKVNDTYGHQFGDEVLRVFANTISHSIRQNDIFARWGGEEFVLLIIGTTEDMALCIAEKLREQIASLEFKEMGSITCSIGLSQYKDGDTPESWLSRVDEALYKAKEQGRNRVEVI